MVTYSDLFQLLLVLIGLTGLVYDVCKHNNGKRK